MGAWGGVKCWGVGAEGFASHLKFGGWFCRQVACVVNLLRSDVQILDMMRFQVKLCRDSYIKFRAAR